MPTTPVQGLPYPALSDPANGPVALQNLALALEAGKTIVTCTSATRPPHLEGRVIYETDTDVMLVSDGAAWQTVKPGAWLSWPCTWSVANGGAAIGNGTVEGRFSLVGKTVNFSLFMILGTTSTVGAGGTFRFSLPVAARVGGRGYTAGGRMEDAGNAAYGVKAGFLRDANTTEFLYDHSPFVASNAPFAWGANDYITVTGMYEAA